MNAENAKTAAEWLRDRAGSYANDARTFREHRKVHGKPMLSEDEDATWAAVYQVMADELYKCAAEVPS